MVDKEKLKVLSLKARFLFDEEVKFVTVLNADLSIEKSEGSDMLGRRPERVTKTVKLKFSNEEHQPVYYATVVINQDPKHYDFTSFTVGDTKTTIGKKLPAGELVFEDLYHTKGIRGYLRAVSGTQQYVV